jgi:hypothetical protein
LVAVVNLTFWLSLQVNPTNVGHHDQGVSLYDGDVRLAVIHRSIMRAAPPVARVRRSSKASR